MKNNMAVTDRETTCKKKLLKYTNKHKIFFKTYKISYNFYSYKYKYSTNTNNNI